MFFRKLTDLAEMATSTFLPLLLLAVAGITEGKHLYHSHVGIESHRRKEKAGLYFKRPSYSLDFHAKYLVIARIT
jgi:hypothetical protein